MSAAYWLVRTKFPDGGADLLVMNFAAGFADDEGLGFWPSMETIGGELRKSKQQARRVVKRLVKGGWLILHEPPNRPGAKRQTAHYRLNLEQLRSAPYPNEHCKRLAGKVVNKGGAAIKDDTPVKSDTPTSSDTGIKDDAQPLSDSTMTPITSDTGPLPEVIARGTVEVTVEVTGEKQPSPEPSGDGTDAAADKSQPFTVESPDHPGAIRPADDITRAVVLIPLVASKGLPGAITEKQVQEWETAYPAVDVRAVVQQIRQWNLSNPSRRKTPKGLRDHVTSWLAKEQNKGGRQRGISQLRQPRADPRPDDAPERPEVPGGVFTKRLRRNWMDDNKQQEYEGLATITWGGYLRIYIESNPLLFPDYPLEEAINAYPEAPNDC